MASRLRLLVVLVLCCLSSSCAFGTRRAELFYPPEGAQAAAIAANAGGPTVALGTFTDERSDKTVVGHVRNGFGMKTAKVETASDVVPWVREALRLELAKAGFQVVEASADGSGPVLSGEILTVYCDSSFEYEGEVSLLATLTRGGEELLRQRYTGEDGAGVNWAASSGAFAESLALALRKTLAPLVVDVRHELVTP